MSKALLNERIKAQELIDGLKPYNYDDITVELLEQVFPKANVQEVSRAGLDQLLDLFIDDYVFTLYRLSEEEGHADFIIKINDGLGISDNVVTWFTENGIDTELEGKIIDYLDKGYIVKTEVLDY